MKADEPAPLWKELALLLIKVAIVASVAAGIMIFVFGAVRAPSTGMEPRIRGNDLLIYNRLPASYEQYDVVFVNYRGQVMPGRIVAKEGDVVDIADGALRVNGTFQVETAYAAGATTQFEGGVTFPVTVPPGHYFILGDNRPEAVDSRIYGTVSEDDILGILFLQLRRSDF